MTTISIHKIGLLIKRQWFESRKIYMASTSLLILALAFLFAITYHWRDSFSGGVRNGIFLIGLFLGGGLYSSSFFGDLTNKSRGMWLLTIPASAAEKLITAAFFGIVIYATIYVLAFTLVDQVYVLVVNSVKEPVGKIDLFKNGFYNFFFTYITYCGLVTLGSIYFDKAPFVKTMMVLIGQFFIVSGANNLILQWFTGLPEVVSTTPFGNFQFRSNGENIYVNLPDNVGEPVSFVFSYILPIVLWYIAYVCLTEKEQ